MHQDDYLLLQVQLGFNGEGDIVAHHRYILSDAKFRTLDGAFGAEAQLLAISDRVDARAVKGNIERHRLGYAVEGEIPRHLTLGCAQLFDFGAGERRGWELGRIEPLGAFQLPLQFFVVGVDAGDIHRHAQFAFFWGFGIECQAAIDLVKAAIIVGKAHVAEAEQHIGVRRVNRIGARGGFIQRGGRGIVGEGAGRSEGNGAGGQQGKEGTTHGVSSVMK